MKHALLQLLIFLIIGCAARLEKKGEYDYSGMDKTTIDVHKRMETFLHSALNKGHPLSLLPEVRIDSVFVDKEKQNIIVFFNKIFSYPAFRPDNVQAVYNSMKVFLGKKYSHYKLTAQTIGYPIETLIPNIYRLDSSQYDRTRMPSDPLKESRPLVQNISQKAYFDQGLAGRHIALWHSHGWYYNRTKDRWEWQRPRLFQTVEDLLPLSFTLPYLVPMLENAGCHVFIPRERDTRSFEVIVDADQLTHKNGVYFETVFDSLFEFKEGVEKAFGPLPDYITTGTNPFKQGKHRVIKSFHRPTAQVEWIPVIPETGFYYVSISYNPSPENVNDAHYTVYHLGGKTEFQVDQTRGGRTWIYLGRFKFKAGLNSDSGKVVLDNKSNQNKKYISADAVRFGGGMGNIIRNNKKSGRARYQEAARYYLQYTGMPDTLVYNLHQDQDDYKDDYKSRGEWVNYLKGDPFGPNKKRTVKGLGIPIDLSVAFHTDAGITRGDSVIGTLAIYSIEGADSQHVFPDGMSRLVNRDFADLMQTQIVNDIRQKYNPQWNRRHLYDGEYSETYRPNVPSVLIELLSHQNYNDMKYALDPRFRFDMARSFYKGILRFLSFQHDFSYKVQPLPVTHMHACFTDTASVKISWKPNPDPMEPTAIPAEYIIYKRMNKDGFDNGTRVKHPFYIFNDMKPNIIYSFKVSAVNRGGKSFPSEILSVARTSKNKPKVLIVNGFDRVCGPERIDLAEFKGFLHDWDNGVADRYDVNFTGKQLDFNPKSKFRLNDYPGHGASSSAYETRIIPGNTFDFVYLHAESIVEMGYPVVSTSDEALMDSLVNLSQFNYIDLIMGEEKETKWPGVYTDSLLGTQFKSFPEKLQDQIKQYCQQGGNILISGAHVASDLCQNKSQTHSDVEYAKDVLKFTHVTDHACHNGLLFCADDRFMALEDTLRFNVQYNKALYTVESPDALAPVNGSKTILRYTENNFSAGICYCGDYKLVVLGFPVETMKCRADRLKLLSAIFNLFNSK